MPLLYVMLLSGAGIILSGIRMITAEQATHQAVSAFL